MSAAPENPPKNEKSALPKSEKSTLPIVHPTANEKSDVSSIFHETGSRQRTFTVSQKQECWNRASIMLGRHPDRFRLDAVGNPVCRVLTNCLGPLCHEYDHIFPFSKGGTTSVDNCQILQSTVNRVKSNRVEISYNEMKAASPKTGFTEEELDAVERAIYGNVLKIDMKFHFDHQKKAKD